MDENKRALPKGLLPESRYSIDPYMSLEELNRCKQNGNLTVGKVLYYDESLGVFIVDLGNSFTGKIPLEEFSIYPCRKENGRISSYVSSLIGSTICASVFEINSKEIILSRKSNMIKAFDYLCSIPATELTCYITRFSPGNNLYLDVGHGIFGRVHFINISHSIIRDPRDIGIFPKSLISAKILSINTADCSIDMGYKQLFPDLSTILEPGDYVEAFVTDRVAGTSDGYFVYLNPNTRAIVSSLIELNYGDRIIATVRKEKYKGKVRLYFLSFK